MFDRDQTKRPAEINARCRKCPECLAHRRRLWTARAIDEWKASSRSWFGTLTLSPEQHWRMECIAAVRVSRRRCEGFEALTPAEQFAERNASINIEITRWLKRVRKQTGARFRYLLVVEAHKSGLPHYHLLLHEHEGSVPKRVLDAQWKLGHAKFRLVKDEAEAAYVCKYLSKSAMARVRASARYGRAELLIRAYAERAAQAASVARTILNEDGAPGVCPRVP